MHVTYMTIHRQKLDKTVDSASQSQGFVAQFYTIFSLLSLLHSPPAWDTHQDRQYK